MPKDDAPDTRIARRMQALRSLLFWGVRSSGARFRHAMHATSRTLEFFYLPIDKCVGAINLFFAQTGLGRRPVCCQVNGLGGTYGEG